MKTLITQQQLKNLLNHDPETGVFTWRESPRHKEGDTCGTMTSHGSLSVTIAGVQYYLHNLSWLWVHGEHPPKGSHISGKALARTASNSNKKTGLRGAYRLKKSNRWISRMQHNHKQITLGVFDSKEEAHAAYLEAKKQLIETGKLSDD